MRRSVTGDTVELIFHSALEGHKVDLMRRNKRYDITQSYMIFGGIPFYLGYMNKELTQEYHV